MKYLPHVSAIILSGGNDRTDCDVTYSDVRTTSALHAASPVRGDARKCDIMFSGISSVADGRESDVMCTDVVTCHKRRIYMAFLLLLMTHIVQELCESRGGRPGLSVLTSLLVSVDVKIY